MSRTTNPSAKVEQIRAAMERAQIDLARLDVAPVPRDQKIAALRHWLTNEAEKFAEDAASGGLAGLSLVPPSAAQCGALKVPVLGGRDHRAVAVADSTGMVAWLLGADVVADSLAELVPYDDAGTGLPLGERPEMRKKLEAELVRLAAQEEQAVRESEAVGSPIQRRGDADPSIILLKDRPLAAMAK